MSVAQTIEQESENERSDASEKREQWLRFFQGLNPATNPETLRLMGQLRQVAHSMYQVSESSLQAADLSYAQYRVLMALLFSEQIEGRGSLNPSEISRMQGTSRNTISSLIRSLEGASLVERELDPQDRRKFNICLTDAGRRIVHDHAHSHSSLIDSVFDVLDDTEVRDFGRILTKLNRALAQANA
jgi:DNA-binding MarR family transcriptional regulator